MKHFHKSEIWTSFLLNLLASYHPLPSNSYRLQDISIFIFLSLSISAVLQFTGYRPLIVSIYEDLKYKLAFKVTNKKEKKNPGST